MRLLVIGAGVSGKAAARLGRRRGDEVIVYDHNPEALEGVGEPGTRVVAGTWSDELVAGIDIVVVSPGIPPHAPPIRGCLEAGITVWSELEFAARSCTTPLVAVTGTNGKTTTTLLIVDMLQRSGRKATAAGNIGTALSDVVDEAWDVLVVEASSFQLRFIEDFRAGVAVVLNAAEDHLDWHGTVDAYRRAKARITENQTGADLFVYDGDDPGATEIAARTSAQKAAVSGIGPGQRAGVRAGWLEAGSVSVRVDDLSISDPAYLVDLAAGAVAAGAAGAEPAGITEALHAFRPGEHRRRLVAERDGVAWIDDSKATNPHAALASVGAYASVVLIAGGRSKGLDLGPLVRHPHVKAVVAVGEAQDELVASAEMPSHRASSIEEAVALGASVATSGDVVLLAPGCASFDMFSSYAARGDAFAAAVIERVLR